MSRTRVGLSYTGSARNSSRVTLGTRGIAVSLDDPCLSSVTDEAESEDENENEDDGKLLFRRRDDATTSCVAGDGAKAWQP